MRGDSESIPSISPIWGVVGKDFLQVRCRPIADICDDCDVGEMGRARIRTAVALIGVATVAAIGFVAGASFTSSAAFDDYLPSEPIPGLPFDAVLDGDTVIEQGRAIHIRGLDAPELGPWASCWAEAALAGTAKNALEATLSEDRDWRLLDVRADAEGRLTGNVSDKDGFDIADEMRVHGSSAMTDGTWDWCGPNSGLHDPLVGEAPPMGPSLWWPSGRMFDPRAAD
jgi:endonuclease YncB( thermonuclease family)